MLTRIEISGFKSFTNFAVDLAPLTLIAGANGSGKSNLFDALQLLSLLAGPYALNPLKVTRGGLLEAFTKYENGKTAERMSFAVEMTLPPAFVRQLDEKPAYLRLRYEIDVIKIQNDYVDSFPVIARESISVPENDSSNWKLLFERQVATSTDFGPKFEVDSKFSHLTPTLLSQVSLETDVHIRAIKTILTDLSRIDLNEVDNFSDYGSGHTKQEVNKVLASLIQISRDPSALGALSRRVQQVVKEISSVSVYTDNFRRTSVTAEDTSGRKFLVESLSEGTRRMIALTALYIQSKNTESLLLEEPENGIDPRVIIELLHLLTDYAAIPVDATVNQRQVFCTTHSPTLLRQALDPDFPQDNLTVLLAQRASTTVEVAGEKRKVSTTRMNPIIINPTDGKDAPLHHYTLRQAMNYLKQSFTQGFPVNVAN